MRKTKLVLFFLAKMAGLFHLARWLTRGRLKILCYHGFVLADEAVFRPKLFIDAEYAEYIKPAAIDADSSYKEVLEAAMAKEREAVETYATLARLVDDPEAKKVFTILHEEEQKHLMRLETEYDDLTNQNW